MIEKALAEVLEKYGRPNWHGKPFAKIALHRLEEYDLQLGAHLLDLPYSFDDTGEIKYAVRRIDQVINLEVWK